MRKIMIVLIVCLFSLNCNSQKFIGQTKSYIISQCQEHEIVINDDNFLVLSYLGHDQFFLFGSATCSIRRILFFWWSFGHLISFG